MSRLYLNLRFARICRFPFFLWGCFTFMMFFDQNEVFAQGELKKYLEIAEEKMEKGDLIHAMNYYDKAMQMDSSSINILWGYAEVLRAYKDYRKAEYYYQKVFEREGAELFPASLLYLGLMQKHNAKYDDAIATFKRAKKVYRKDARGYLAVKSRQELQSCLWAKSQQLDTLDLVFHSLPESINSKDAEFPHSLTHSHFYFSSMRGDSIGDNEEVYAEDYQTNIYKAHFDQGAWGEVNAVESLNFKSFSTGNGTFSLDNKRFYFSRCTNENNQTNCKIMVAKHTDGVFSKVDELGEIINAPGHNTTMPYIGEWDGQEVLFFASDREGGKGGLDIWYSFISNGNQYKKPRNLKRINSIENEVTPFWDNQTQTIYFSSTWHYGFGGYDVFKSQFSNNQFEAPQNLGLPFNSPANDTYFFQTLTKDTSIWSSNRLGVNYSKNPTCCNDIFMVSSPPPPPPPTFAESLEELNKRLPVTLYFHNDIPNPRSRDTVTSVNYLDSYNEYIAMLNKYQKEYAKGLRGAKAADAKDDIEDFFIEFVKQGVENLFLFRDLLLDELQRGRHIELTVKGFASPLAQSDYNVNLTKRRIASLRNYLMEYDNGIFQPYFDGNAASGGKLWIQAIPFGEYTADAFVSDNPNDVQNSIYSRAAAMERKIEIQSVTIHKQESAEKIALSVNPPIINVGAVKQGTLITKKYVLSNTGDTQLDLKTEIPCDCNSVELEKLVLAPGESTEVKLSFDTTNYEGKEVKSVYIHFNENQDPLRLVITAEITKD